MQNDESEGEIDPNLERSASSSRSTPTTTNKKKKVAVGNKRHKQIEKATGKAVNTRPNDAILDLPVEIPSFPGSRLVSEQMRSSSSAPRIPRETSPSPSGPSFNSFSSNQQVQLTNQTQAPMPAMTMVSAPVTRIWVILSSVATSAVLIATRKKKKG